MPHEQQAVTKALGGQCHHPVSTYRKAVERPDILHFRIVQVIRVEYRAIQAQRSRSLATILVADKGVCITKSQARSH